MISCIIIEDEILAQNMLKEYLYDIEGILIKEVCSNGFDGLKSIQKHKPDFIILDVQMPKLTGFEMLDLLEDIPYVIFATAYDNFAIKAFELNAVDYLLKPYAKTRFIEAIKKVKKRIENNEPKKYLDNTIKTLNKKEEKLLRIAVKSGQSIHVLPIETVRYIEAQDDYIMLHTQKGRFLKQTTLKKIESMLENNAFFRIHRSYIVNLECVKKIFLYEKDRYMIELDKGEQLRVSREKYKSLKEILNY